MKLIFQFLLLTTIALFTTTARADMINGHSYVALEDWAKANGFHLTTRNQGSEFLLANKTSHLVFDTDSADATINDINVRLSYPVAKDGLISQIDIDNTLRPLLFKQKATARPITTICLDPGHGGKDIGNHVGRILSHNEKTYTLALALELRQQLQSQGFKVILTRDKDVYPELSERPDIANRHHADLFISLHFNSSPANPASVEGPETYCITPVGAASSNDSDGVGAGHSACPANRYGDKSLLLAYQVQHSLVRSLGTNDRSVRRARFEVLRTAEMPAILIEGGYMSHPQESKKIFDSSWRKQLAAAIVHGVLNYQKLTEPAHPKAPASRAAANHLQAS